jgi:hypothetical protein
VIRPSQPALCMALSMASTLLHPCSGMTSGRYVAEKTRFVDLDLLERRLEEEDKGEGVLEGDVMERMVAG